MASFAGLTGSIEGYTIQIGLLTNEMTDLMMDKTMAARDSADLAISVSDARQAVKGAYAQGTDEYEDAMDEINNEYQTALAEITAWESELQSQIDQDEVEIQTLTATKESMEAITKENIPKAFKFGGSQ